MMAPFYSSQKHSHGMVLIVVLIMLGILTLIVAALVRTGNINFRIAGNQQYRQEARLSAQQGIESYLATPNIIPATPHLFPDDPLVARTSSFVTKSEPMDLDGDGAPEYSATVPSATYLGERLVLFKELSVSDKPLPDSDEGLSDADKKLWLDNQCRKEINISGASGGNQQGQSGLAGQTRCRDMVWDVKATVTDTATGVAVELHQGVTKRYR